MESNSSENPEKVPAFAEQVGPLLADLYYPSESDEPITVVSGPPATEGSLTDTHIRQWLQLPEDKPVEERPEEDFWQPVTEEKDWYGEEEKARTEKFKQVKAVAEQQLTDRQVFRVGETEIDLYLIGRQPDCTLAGLKTLIVET